MLILLGPTHSDELILLGNTYLGELILLGPTQTGELIILGPTQNNEVFSKIVAIAIYIPRSSFWSVSSG